VGARVGSGIKLATIPKNITPAKNYMNQKIEHLLRTTNIREDDTTTELLLLYDDFRSTYPTQRLPFKKPSEFKAL